MNEQSAYLVRAIRGPVILITVGVLFAFDRFTRFGFHETWPVLLIVMGLLRLVAGGGSWRRDYPGDQYQRGGYYPPSPPPAAAPPPQPPANWGEPGARP
jgi:hypothetical protein